MLMIIVVLCITMPRAVNVKQKDGWLQDIRESCLRETEGGRGREREREGEGGERGGKR